MYTVYIDKRAVDDIRCAIDYYESKVLGLGEKFEIEVDEYINSLELNPFFEIRYNDVRCLPLKKFPYMIHFRIDKVINKVFIDAVLHTSLDPKIWTERQ